MVNRLSECSFSIVSILSIWSCGWSTRRRKTHFKVHGVLHRGATLVLRKSISRFLYSFFKRHVHVGSEVKNKRSNLKAYLQDQWSTRLVEMKQVKRDRLKWVETCSKHLPQMLLSKTSAIFVVYYTKIISRWPWRCPWRRLPRLPLSWRPWRKAWKCPWKRCPWKRNKFFMTLFLSMCHPHVASVWICHGVEQRAMEVVRTVIKTPQQ